MAADLDGAGYFSLTDPERAAEIKAMFITGEGPFSEYPYLFDADTRRVVPIDAENVAEGGVADELLKLQAPLSAFGVDLKSVAEIADEMAEEPNWLQATQRALAVVNQLLRQAGAPERVYLLYVGELSLAMFLTPQMFELLQQSDALSPYEKPMEIG